MKTKKQKPRYNMWQNMGYMVGKAWNGHKNVLVLLALEVMFAAGIHTAELFAVPVILKLVEQRTGIQILLGAIGGFTLLLAVLNAAGGYIRENTLFGRIGVRSGLVCEIGHKLNTMSYCLLGDKEAMDRLAKASRATEGNSEATEAVWTTISELLTNSICFAVYLSVLSKADPVLILVTLAATLCSYFFSKNCSEWEYRHQEEREQYDKEIYYWFQDLDNEHLGKDIRLFHMKPWLDEVYQNSMRLLSDFFAGSKRKYLEADLLALVLSFLQNGIAYWYLLNMTLEQKLSASEFLLMFTAINGFNTWVTGILSGLNTLHRQSLDITIVREFIEYPEPFAFEDGKPLSLQKGQDCELRMEHVSFRYPQAKEDTIHDMNLVIHPGEKLAIVGMNGAGKTTLIKLLCGLYDPTEGRVLLNGQDIRQYNRRDYYRLLSAVFQEFSVMDITVKENVAMEEQADEKRVWRCLELAGLREKIESLPRGLETHLGRNVFLDGTELSGGETQRLMLARALYKDGALLVLDEPTAALDPLAENDIYNKYREMSAGKTSIFISHRLASTRFCDRILLLENGRIAEEGTHEQLIQKGGQYAALFEIQKKYYKNSEEEA